MARDERQPVNGYLSVQQRADLTEGDRYSEGDTQPPYMTDNFASGIQRPKFKFNYTVTIKFREAIPLPRLIRNGEGQMDQKLHEEVSFLMKQATRPNPTITYQDINHYNYRTKVATKMDYGTMQLTMYDDVQNIAHDLFEVYLKSISPIANKNKAQANNLFTNGEGPRNSQFNSAGFVEGAEGPADGGSGSIGPLPPGAGDGTGNESGIIENICIRHWFWSDVESRSKGGGEGADTFTSTPQIQYVEYQFLNPKIINMTLDELDMTQSDVNTVMLNFSYDSVYIDTPQGYNADLVPLQPEPRTLTFQDLRGRVADIERLVRRVRRLDTIPDVPIANTLDGLSSIPGLGGLTEIIPPISGLLDVATIDRIPGVKPVVDALPDILDF